MKTTKEIRRHNLAFLVTSRFDGNKSSAARALGWGQPQRMINYLSGAKSIGGNVARAIEVTLELENGWLDTNRTEAADIAKSDHEVQLLLCFRALYSDQREKLLGAIRDLAKLNVSRQNEVVALDELRKIEFTSEDDISATVLNEASSTVPKTKK